MIEIPFELVLVNIRSRFNVGAMFRTADAVGITKIHLCGYTPAPPHPKIDKVALGSEKTVPFARHRQALPLLRELKKNGYILAAVEQSRTSIPYFKFKRPKLKPLALVMGNEVTGLPKQVLQLADVKVEIPMRGQKESLNVGVAFGIMAYRLAYP
ncbi:MAG: TrmH family RNA methyltransferase [Candidatus Kerfeldbacteria bacterium]|nr:TrmH family RNA methyltransferase [Candidatus Kerfeldbacteria bacterium]